MTLVLGAGLGAGVGLAFLLSQLWPTFDSRRSLMESTGIPVLGSVGMMLSPPALHRERWLTVAYASFGGMLLVILRWFDRHRERGWFSVTAWGGCWRA